MIRPIRQFICGRRETYVVHAYDSRRQGPGRRDPAVVEYAAGHDLPRERVRQMVAIVGRLAFWPMHRRMRRFGGKLLCLLEGDRIVAYGWVQGWEPFRRRFGWLAKDAVMLGFYWTAPEFRGRGLYGRLLAHSIAACERRDQVPLLIMTSLANAASQRGIAKAGFQRLGVFEIASSPLGLAPRHRIVEQACTLGRAADGRVVVLPVSPPAAEQVAQVRPREARST